MCDVRRVRVIGRVARLAVATALFAAAPLAQARGAPADDIDRARTQVLDDSYQAELPGHAGGGAAAPAADARPGRTPGGELAADDRRIDARDHTEPAAVSSVMTMLLWGLVVVIGMLGAGWLASELSRGGGDAELPAEDLQARMQAAGDAILDRPLGDADELARGGRFAEAIHTLLLRTLQELVHGAAVRVAPATTSREILARVPLLADARAALAGLITAVEVTHFGDAPASDADYERCRQQFHVFATAFRASPQAVAA
jgi:hypothetical protein